MARYRDLVAPLLAIIAATSLYATFASATGIPGAGSLIGHSLGIAGFGLMLMTETLYSLRKRAMHRPWGTMRAWLRFHIFTGIVGPYLVVMHAAWSFHGLAGWLTAMTVVVVASGFIGRYIYTAVPRTADGVMVEARELQLLLDSAQLEAALPLGGGTAAVVAIAGGGQARQATRRLRELERQMAALRWARRTLATWHMVHVPLGIVLFVLGFSHVAAALYYATLLR